MQDFLDGTPENVNFMKNSLSQPRFQKYLNATDHDDASALALYHWNMLISQSLYNYLQCWEICYRNKMNAFLCWKYNGSWPYDDNRAVRNMKVGEKNRLRDTIDRQERERKAKKLNTDIIVSDLSAGFWVALLSNGYKIPYTWQHNIIRIFPNDRGIDRQYAWEASERVLTLRNRIAHHEPVFGMKVPIEDTYEEMKVLVAAMCKGTSAFANSSCNFHETLKLKPK